MGSDPFDLQLSLHCSLFLLDGSSIAGLYVQNHHTYHTADEQTQICSRKLGQFELDIIGVYCRTIDCPRVDDSSCSIVQRRDVSPLLQR